jgi:hypothetical protein
MVDFPRDLDDPHHEDADHHDHAPVFNTANAEGRMNWVFFDFWPIMIWVAVFSLMCAIPIVLSGTLHGPFSAADVVWWGYGLVILAVMLGALGIFIVIPRFVGIYTLLVSIYYLIMAERFHAWQVGGTQWGNSITILFLTYVLVGNFIFMQADRPAKRRRPL